MFVIICNSVRKNEMKYINIIIFIIVIASGFAFYSLIPEKEKSSEDVALTINGRDIDQQTVHDEQERTGYHTENRELYGAIITRELLIQEAKRQQLDKKESFRQALQNYYENSLINILLDQKNQEIEVKVDDKEIDRYLDLLGSLVTFTRIDDISATKESGQPGTENTTTALFDDLAEPVKLLLASMTLGQVGVRFDTGSDRYAIRLDMIEKNQAAPPSRIPDRDHVRKQIADFKREQQFNLWLQQLNEAATITIHEQQPSS